MESGLQHPGYQYHPAERNGYAYDLLRRKLFPEHDSAGKYVEHRLHIIAERARCDGRIFERLKLADPVAAHQVELSRSHPIFLLIAS